MGCFQLQAKTKLVVDASPTGLGAILLQGQKTGDDKVIAYTSRTLNDVEQNYSQLEREGLAIFFGCIRFQVYLLGKDFLVYSDHKALVSLFNNPKKQSPFRIERTRLKLQGFRFTVCHLPGSSNPSDYESRHPTPFEDKDDACKSEELKGYVNEIISPACNPVTMEEIKKAYASDDAMRRIIELLQEGKTPTQRDKILTIYCKVWAELSFVEDLVLRHDRIVIPPSFREKIVKIAHEGHLGIVKTKMLLRSKVWIPEMDKLVEKEIQGCLACQPQYTVIIANPW